MERHAYEADLNRLFIMNLETGEDVYKRQVEEWYPIAWVSIPASSIEPSEHNNMPKV